jgi:hypothetical protein
VVVVTASVVRLFVGSALVAGGLSKFRDRDGAAIALLDYRLIPKALAPGVAFGLAAAELAVGAATLVGDPFATALAVLLLTLFTGAVGLALARHLDIDCHCAGGGKLTATTLIRNASMIAALGWTLLVSTTSRLTEATPAYVVSVAAATALCVALAAKLRTDAINVGRSGA